MPPSPSRLTGTGGAGLGTLESTSRPPVRHSRAAAHRPGSRAAAQRRLGCVTQRAGPVTGWSLLAAWYGARGHVNASESVQQEDSTRRAADARARVASV